MSFAKQQHRIASRYDRSMPNGREWVTRASEKSFLWLNTLLKLINFMSEGLTIVLHSQSFMWKYFMYEIICLIQCKGRRICGGLDSEWCGSYLEFLVGSWLNRTWEQFINKIYNLKTFQKPFREPMKCLICFTTDLNQLRLLTLIRTTWCLSRIPNIAEVPRS